MLHKRSAEKLRVGFWDRVSRFLDRILKECVPGNDAYELAMRRALARKPFLRSNGRYLSREEVHDRSRLR